MAPLAFLGIAVQTALTSVSSAIVPTPLQVSYHHPHCTDNETEAQRHHVSLPRPQLMEWQHQRTKSHLLPFHQRFPNLSVCQNYPQGCFWVTQVTESHAQWV